MRIKLKDDKSIAFLDGSGEINTNDVMRQVLEVEPETPLVTGESLWIVFAASEFTYTGEILFQEEAGIYKMPIPEGVLKVPGEWHMQLFVRLYSTTDPTKYITQLSSDIALFTVQEGLPVEDGQPINSATIGNLWNETKKNAETALNSAERAEAAYDQLINVDLPNNYVTVDTNQTISGNKTHTGINTFNGFTSINGIGIDADAIVKGSDRFKYPVKSGTLALTSDIPENIVTKDENGQIKVPLAPAQDDDAVSKKYVDDADNTKLNKVEPFANGTYAYIVSKDDRFGTTNGYTEISETDKISTIVKRKTNGCIETRTPSADVEAANKGYVDTAISDTQGQLAQTNQNVEDLYTILEQAQVVTVTTLEQAYTARETADGENIVDGVQTTVKKIQGKTVATENLIPYPYTETTKTANGVTFTVNSDGSITVNGTATSDADFMLLRGPIQGYSESYFLSGCPSGGSDTTYYISENFTASKDTGNGVVLNNLPSDQVWRIIIKSGTTVNNLVFRPMLNEGTEAKPYSKWFAGLKNASFEKIVSTGRNLYMGGDLEYDSNSTVNTISQSGFFSFSKNIIQLINQERSITFSQKYTLIRIDCETRLRLSFLINCLDGTTYNPEVAHNQESGREEDYTITFSLPEGKTVKSGGIWINDNSGTFQGAWKSRNNMLNIGASALPYEPYISDTLSAATPIELAEYDVAYPETGETKRNSGKKVFDGTETWEARGSAGDLYRYGAVLANVKTSGACVANLSGENSGASVAGNYFIDTEFKVFTNIATVDEWKAHLAEITTAGNPLTVIYETAEATTEATPFDKSKYIAWKNGSETIEQGPTDNSEYGAENTVKQDYFTLTGGTTNV